MSRFEWKAEYSVGDDTIDAQHRKLLAILNELADQLTDPANASTDAARAVFEHLAAYVTEHFDYEEQRIAAAGYPEDALIEHRREHNALLAQVQAFEDVFERGDRETLERMMPFLYGEWLIHHICGTDKDYAPYLARD